MGGTGILNKLLITALPDYRSAAIASFLQAISEITLLVADLMMKNRAMRSKHSSAALSPRDYAALRMHDNEEFRLEYRKMTVYAAKLISSNIGEYSTTVAMVGGNVICYGNQRLLYLSSDYLDFYGGMKFLTIQFVPEILTDFVSLCIMHRF